MIEVKRIHIVVPKDLYFRLRDGGFLDVVDEMATKGLYEEMERREKLMNELILRKCNSSGNNNAHEQEELMNGQGKK